MGGALVFFIKGSKANRKVINKVIKYAFLYE